MLVPAIAASMLWAPAALAHSVTVQTASVEAAFDDTGAYQVRCRETRWTLSGELDEKPESVLRRSGADRLGRWQEVAARTRTQVATIRVYESKPIVLFRDQRLEAGRNSGVFPTFESLPRGLTEFSYRVTTFATYEFGRLGAEGPWVLFDGDRRTMVLAPADHFLVADMTEGARGVSAGGIDPAIGTLPAGFRHGTLLVVGNGITHTLDAWGHALQMLNGKRPVADDADPVLSKLGYWTDNGATYYYKFVPALGYEGTLLSVRDAFKKLGVPLAYLQLDSWWYPKEKGNSLTAMAVNGETVYRASPKIFPEGLRAFHRKLGLPLVVHARWVAEESPYRREYTMSRNVVLSPAFWNATAKYLHRGGVEVYEQDWLNDNARPALNLTDPQAFLGNMAHAMARQGIAIQYCMALPGYFLASTRYQTLETIRVSDDRFGPSRWNQFLYGSALARAVGLWPWSDVFMSSELPELILSTLSAGPVGVGDALGRIDVQNLRRAMRADSVLLKPDESIEPLDASFIAEAQNPNAPMVAATRSGNEVEVFAYPRATPDRQVTVKLSELGISGPAYAWDWVRHTGRRIPAGGSFSMIFRNGWAYVVVAPVDGSGIALLGDTGKIVPLSRERFPEISYSHGAQVAMTFAAGEDAVTVTGYAAIRPYVRANHGRIDPLEYSPTTHLFQVTAHPAETQRLRASTAELMMSATRH